MRERCFLFGISYQGNSNQVLRLFKGDLGRQNSEREIQCDSSIVLQYVGMLKQREDLEYKQIFEEVNNK